MRKWIVLAGAGSVLFLAAALVYAQGKTEPAKEHHITGVVKETIPADKEKKTHPEVVVLTKETKDGKDVDVTLTFTLVPGSKVMLGDKAGKFKDIDKGDKVKVTYHHNGDVREVILIDVSKDEKEKAPVTKTPADPATAPGTNAK